MAKYDTFLSEVSKYYVATNDKVDPEVDGSLYLLYKLLFFHLI